METIFLSQNTMLITLTVGDAEKYGCADADGVISSIRDILHDACGGFDYLTEGEALNAELYMAPDGGCEIFITKTGEKDMLYGCERKAETKQRCQGASAFYYKFEDTEGLLSFCRELTSSERPCDAEIYYDTEEGTLYAATPSESYQAHEFGGEKCSELDGYYISEHFEKFAEGAVGKFAAFAL